MKIEIGADLLLADELAQQLGPQRGLPWSSSRRAAASIRSLIGQAPKPDTDQLLGAVPRAQPADGKRHRGRGRRIGIAQMDQRRHRIARRRALAERSRWAQHRRLA